MYDKLSLESGGCMEAFTNPHLFLSPPVLGRKGSDHDRTGFQKDQGGNDWETSPILNLAKAPAPGGQVQSPQGEGDEIISSLVENDDRSPSHVNGLFFFI